MNELFKVQYQKMYFYSDYIHSRSRADLALLPSSTAPQVLPGAGHPAYLDQPRLWHKLLLNFLVAIQNQGRD